MDEDPGLSEQYRTASPWPLFVALGIPISEIGLLFDLFPIAVGGLVLFCGSVAGMTDEAGYADGPWGALGVLAVLCLVAGGVLLAAVGQPTRGAAVLVAGALLLAAGVAGRLFVHDDVAPIETDAAPSDADAERPRATGDSVAGDDARGRETEREQYAARRAAGRSGERSDPWSDPREV